MSNLSRRRFLKLSAVTAVGAALSACAQPTPQVVKETVVVEKPVEKVVKETVLVKETVAVKQTVVVEKTVQVEKVVTATPAPIKYKEAPMLAELVKAGKLPAVDQRLPVEPLVLQPVESVGKYGGKWTWMNIVTTWAGSAVSMVNWVENFLKYNRDMSGKRPNLITKFSWNATGTEITLYFRKGVKWSDGQPLTVADWLFWWEDMTLDPKINLPKQTGPFVKGEPMKTTKLDDFTLKCTFVAPNPLFLDNLCRGTGGRATSWQVIPAHYMKKYHYKYNTALKDTDTKDLLDRYNNRIEYPDMPHFGPWLTKTLTQGVSLVMERNPYYWKVDTEGNQLPYMDGVEVRAAKDQQLITLSAVNGELDFQCREMAVKDIPVLKENEAKGGYKVLMWQNGYAVATGLRFHYCYKDKGYADLFWNQKFRQAISWAIDRNRVNDIVFLGTGVPQQHAPFPSTSEFQTARGKKLIQDWANLCAAYQPDTAKKLLDEIGVVDKNKDGFREKPDGSELNLIIDVAVTNKEGTESMQLVSQDLQKVGIKLTLNVIDSTLQNQRINTCESMMRERNSAASGLYVGQSEWAPVEVTDYTVGGRPYAEWYTTGGKSGIAIPPGSFLEKTAKIYEDALLIADEAKRDDRLLDLYQIWVDEGPIYVGVIGDTAGPVVVKNTLKNVPKFGVLGAWVYGYPATADPEQWYRA